MTVSKRLLPCALARQIQRSIWICLPFLLYFLGKQKVKKIKIRKKRCCETWDLSSTILPYIAILGLDIEYACKGDGVWMRHG
jgi:hypothetical protein